MYLQQVLQTIWRRKLSSDQQIKNNLYACDHYNHINALYHLFALCVILISFIFPKLETLCETLVLRYCFTGMCNIKVTMQKVRFKDRKADV